MGLVSIEVVNLLKLCWKQTPSTKLLRKDFLETVLDWSITTSNETGTKC